MDVIAMESEAFNELIKRIKRIESFIERSSAVLQSIDYIRKNEMSVSTETKCPERKFREDSILTYMS